MSTTAATDVTVGSDAAAAEARPSQVSATGLGSWPGTDPAEAARIIRGELGEPNLPHLVELPDRGVGADPVARTAGFLAELFIDLQPHGWRLVNRPGQDHRRAVSALRTDLNVLADVVGAEDRPGNHFKVQLRGPMSLAANLYLHNGERALIDAGARRDLAQSLADGAAGHLAQVRASLPAGTELVVQLDEPEVDAVLAGSIPTASGYRTLRSVAASEVFSAWDLVASALRDAGAVEVVAQLPAADSALDAVASSSLDGFAIPVGGLKARQWETIAAAVEADRRIWAGLIDPAVERIPQVTALVESVVRPWRQLGLPLKRLPQLRITPSAGLAGSAPEAARSVVKRLTQTADALNQVVAEA
ncbi:hypothetical protein E4J89_03175 [Arthrobacter sp. CAU 1506]|uniref:hypothetical protein n=1 Tax=Arthrobacter sp. CAU 1506 TaxID=2560052 RepID=UPI0010AC8A52|nr:hypothetical protein [Arthrobacter sp. CAU 1506]TJY71283.1 hypothetical protein E4J89_03175 [Arthrobacter sp. CAU 1506]